MITVEKLTKQFGSGPTAVRALDGIDLDVRQGEILAVVGQSGSGKSTLVRCLTHLEEPTSGHVVLDGQRLDELNDTALRTARRKVGQVFQHANLLDQRTAQRNVEYPLEIAGWTKASRRARAAELLLMVGLDGRQENYPSQLSGGQQQRVGIARALAPHPTVLLCDEPTSALDPKTTEELLSLLLRLRDQLGVTIIIITHDLAVVRRVADRVAVLDAGRIVESGPVLDVAVRPGSRILSDVFTEGTLGSDDLRVTGGADLATTSFLSRLSRDLGIDATLRAGGALAIGATHVLKADLSFASTNDRDRAAAWLREHGFTVVTS